MATNASLSLARPGLINGATGTWAQDNALFLKVFSGEVLTAFKRACIFKDFVQKRSISSGKSAQFPVTGRFNARYHVPGTQVVGQGNMAQNEVTIAIDDLLLADASIADIDDAKNHYDIKSIYSTELGEALARQVDQRLARCVVLGARQATHDLTRDLPPGLSPDDPYRTGTRIDLNKANPTPDDYVAAVFAAAATLDRKDVTSDNRVLVATPDVYYTLVQSSRAVNQDFNAPGTNGGYAGGQIARLAGFNIFASNNLVQGNVTAPVGEHGQTWNGNNVFSTVDTTTTKMVAFQRGSVGMVSLKSLTMQMTGNDFNAMYQSTMMVARMAYGAGYLRPEGCVEVFNSL
jgi:hypothetical protein